MKLLALAVVVVVVVGATRGVSQKRRRSPSTSIVSTTPTTKATEVLAVGIAIESPNEPSGADKERDRKRHREHKNEDSSFNRISTPSKDKRSSYKGGVKTRKGKRQKSVTPFDLSLVTPALFDPSYSTLASTTTSTMTDTPPFTFTNITIKRKIANNTEMSVNVFFIWPSSSLPSSWFTTQSPVVNPSLTMAPPVSRNFSVDIHLSKEECIGEFRCSLIPETVYFKVMVPLDEWVRVTIEQSFFIYNTRYFIQLYNNNISRRSESKVFSTPLCRNPTRNFRACLDTKTDVSPSNQDNGNTGLLPKVVCLAMDQIALDNHQVRFRIDWSLEKEHFHNLTNLAALGRGVVDQFLKAQASGKTRSDVVVYNSHRKQLTGSYGIDNTILDIDLAADGEFIVEVVMKCENWTVVYEPLKLSTKIETLRKKLSDGVLKFCPNSPLSGGTNQLKNFVIISIIAFVFLLSFMSACLVLSWKKCREIKMSKTVLTKENSYKSSSVNLLRESVSTCGSVTDEWEIEAGDLELGKEVGQGAFGKVVYGLYKKQRVAVKVLKDDIHSLYKEDLLREIALLKSLGTHQGIVSILGASTHKEPLALVMEYMPYGNLYNFLRRCRSNFDWRHESRELVSIQYMHDDSSGEKEVWEVTSKDLISWARQVAVAMEYMATKQYVHRDLAARNILLGTNKTVKLCDFGLARLIYRGDGHYFRKTNTKLPIKWMALESIRDRVYTSRSDVWSFGILLWEIATFGSCPYPTITLEDLPRYLEEGYRMPQPNNCSDELYLMMMDCWRSNPEDRPTFSEIRSQLEDMLSRDVDYLDLEVGEGESPFSVNRMPSSGNDDNNNNRDEAATDDNGEVGSIKRDASDVSRGTVDQKVGILPNAIDPPSVEKKDANKSENRGDTNQGKTRPNEETKCNLSLPHLVKSKEIAIDKAIVKSAAGKSFGGKIADNVFYHRSVVNDPRKAKRKKKGEEISPGNNGKGTENNETVQSDVTIQRPLCQDGQLPRLAPHPKITINSDINSESFPLLQMSPPPTSPIHSSFRLLDSVTDPGEQGSTGSSDRSPSGDTEDTRSSWMLDII